MASFYISEVKIDRGPYRSRKPSLLLTLRIELANLKRAKLAVEDEVRRRKDERVDFGRLLSLFASIHTTYSSKS